MSIGVAFRAFFAALFQRDVAERIREALDSTSADTPSPTQAKLERPKEPEAKSESKFEAKTEAKPEPKPATPTRSDALTLLSTLQREARLLDLVQEPLDHFQDAQIGAAAREVLKDCRKTLGRMFDIKPLAEQEEGEACNIPSNASPNRLRLIGKSSGTSGTITHRGWQATCCEVPQWNGGRNEAWILAPTEIEVN